MTRPIENHSSPSGLDLRYALFMGFCAVCILAAKMAFRWKLHIPGHSMFFTMFFLILVRSIVPHRFAASFTGFLTGALALMMGMGQGGPFHLLKYLFPALVVDAAAMVCPRFMYGYGTCLFAAAVASASKFFGNAAVNGLAGMDSTVLLQHALLQSAGAVFFGMLGSLLVPPVIRRLEIHGFLKG